MGVGMLAAEASGIMARVDTASAHYLSINNVFGRGAGVLRVLSAV